MPFEIKISEVRLKDAEMEATLSEELKIEILMERLNDFFNSEDIQAKITVNKWV